MPAKRVVDRTAAFAWIAENRVSLSGVTVAKQLGCSYGTGWRVLREYDQQATNRVPLPRWCQPPPAARPRYKLDSLPTTGNRLPINRAVYQQTKASHHGL